jgi:signal transduction histidine kinase
MNGDGGELAVTTSQDAEARLRIAIRDNGVGMTSEKAEQIFKPFFTDKHKGTGLGLSITKNIIDGHGGAIHIESAPNEGTTFTILLPLISGTRS